jgi:hypothetical protein
MPEYDLPADRSILLRMLDEATGFIAWMHRARLAKVDFHEASKARETWDRFNRALAEPTPPLLLTGRLLFFKEAKDVAAWLRSMPTDVEPALALQRRAMALHDAIVAALVEPAAPTAVEAAPPTSTEAPAVDFAAIAEPTKEDRAMIEALKRSKSDGELTVAAIARAVDCSERHLHNCKSFKEFLSALQAHRKPPAKGSKSRETGKIEAWREDD